MKVSKFEVVSITFLITLLAWWVYIYFVLNAENLSQNLAWGATYQLMAWWGGVFGLISSRIWGWFKSRMGRAILFFSIGLLLQGFGQTAFSYYNIILHSDIPYPSVADLGYFLSVIFYILGILTLARVVGTTFSIQAFTGKLIAFIVPALMLGISYTIFLRDYQYDWSAPLRTFLDFGYPLGEAIYVSIAIIALLSARTMLGGIMRTPILVVIFALIAQYVAEFNFLEQAHNGTWINGGYGDALYLLSYFIMSVSLIKIDAALRHQEK